jgi:hypothetical protein
MTMTKRLTKQEMETAIMRAARAMVPRNPDNSFRESDLVDAIVKIFERIEIAKFGRPAAKSGELDEALADMTQEELKRMIIAVRRERIGAVNPDARSAT